MHIYFSDKKWTRELLAVDQTLTDSFVYICTRPYAVVVPTVSFLHVRTSPSTPQKSLGHVKEQYSKDAGEAEKQVAQSAR